MGLGPFVLATQSETAHARDFVIVVEFGPRARRSVLGPLTCFDWTLGGRS